jgi:hypothetical protein
MNRSHFKSFFENYFNYPYEKLKFQSADIIKKELAYFYRCPLNHVDCFFLFSKVVAAHELQYYGFYRIGNSECYIPFFIHQSPFFATPHVNILLDYSINNSIFDCIHVPLKKEKTSDFYNLILENLNPVINATILTSGLNCLNSSVLKTFINFDFDMLNYNLEILNKGKNFNEYFSLSKKSLPRMYDTEIIKCYRYELNYYVKNKKECLFLETNDPANFSKTKMLEQSFSGMTEFGDFDYTSINELNDLVEGYRQLEKMYVI